MTKNAVIIGAGIGGMACAVRLASKGYKVKVFEKNNYPGGKLTSIEHKKYRFDAGPSLFTLPELVDELYKVAGKENTFEYERLKEVCHYFYPDGKKYTAPSDADKFAETFSSTFNEYLWKTHKFIKTIRQNFNLTSPVFLESSLHKLSTYIKPSGLRGIANLWRLNMFTSMHKQLNKSFKSHQALQYFGRFATYNGSNPYKAPATLCVIPHIEINRGAYFPKGGMQSITNAIYKLALECGVEIHLNQGVQDILTENNVATGIRLQNEDIHMANVVVSNADAKLTYKMLGKSLPRKIKKAENSSSAIIFYWGIKKEFEQLGLHNIFFATDYEQEFKNIFETKDLHHDPTIYVNISSKFCHTDAPVGCENWFVMINAPADYGQDWDQKVSQARKYILQKLETMLHEPIETLIETEDVLTPPLIASKTGSHRGSLYGSSSNSIMSAFNRQSNYSNNVKQLYFCGGSVHPGGGIPLCLHGAQIVSNLVPKP